MVVVIMLTRREKENDRLDIAHKLFDVRLKGKLHLAPIGKNPQRILDLGTGTGIWAIEMGDKYPSAEILGNDLSPIQPRWVPPNVRFEVDDIESDWAYSEKFDYIHCRCLASALKDWPNLIRQSFEHTKPGGWVEFQDLDITWTSPDGSLKDSSSIYKANREFISASKKMGMEPSPGPKLEAWVKEAGFTNVVHERMAMPIGTWPADKTLKEVGAWNYLQYMEGLEGFFLALFTRVLDYTPEEVKLFMAQVRKDSKDPKIHAMYHL
ncbi:MAG: hypothetical protein M1830_003317 [Pleopsidium flavum]|nr:MAG: hypothetical protein M1830_003317 [Pleopsidium flavum]